MTAPRAYLFVTFDGGGNVPPVLGLARRLAARGHDVRVLTEPCLRGAVEQAGARFVAFTRHFTRTDGTEDLIGDSAAKTTVGAFKRSLERLVFGPARIVAEETRRAMEAERPDVVAVDVLMPGGLIAAEAAGIPRVVLFHMPEYLPGPGRPAAGPGFLPRTDVVGRVRDGVMTRLFFRQLGAYLPAYNEARRALGLAPLRTGEALMDPYHAADLRLIQTSEAFDFPITPAPPNVRYVGPILDDPEWAGAWRSPWPEGDPRPLVVASLSSTFQDQRGPLQRIITALGTAASGEIVFVGYGSRAPEYQWDDFKGMDVRGKVLLVLVNDPPAPADDAGRFGGRAMTYYGRWTYKFEEAERQGAAGMLIIHTTEQAGYPWHTVVGSWAKEQRMLPRSPSLPAPLGVRGWITDSAATALLGQAGLNLEELRRQAERRDFRPVRTSITLDAGFTNTVQHLESENVVGVVPGSDPALRDQYVVFSGHWDHLGIGPAVEGDSIYNGALDNASGVADLLAMARVAVQAPRPRRSLLFVFVTAEESGLLGSEHFALNPTVPISRIVATLNVDGGNLLGRATDFNLLGENKSSLGPQFAALVGPRGWRVTPDEHPERGYFYRSDHFSFAKAGVPSVSIGAGTQYEGRPAEWGRQQEEAYVSHCYHQPCDEYRADFDLAGAVQLAEVVLDFGMALANGDALPTWNADAEFRRPTQ